MTRYYELNQAGYFNGTLTDEERQAIADKVDGKPKPKVASVEKPAVKKADVKK